MITCPLLLFRVKSVQLIFLCECAHLRLEHACLCTDLHKNHYCGQLPSCELKLKISKKIQASVADIFVKQY